MNQSGAASGSPNDLVNGSANPAAATTGNGVRQVRVASESAGQRIDNFLVRHLKGVPKSRVYRILRRGEVRVNKGRVKADYRLEAGDLVRIPPVRTSAAGTPTRVSDQSLARWEPGALYEDQRLLIVDKPAGLAVHGGSGLSWGLIEMLRQLRPGAELELVHRLDRETSGCLIISKRRSTLRSLHALMREGGIEKRYLALIAGMMKREREVVDAPLSKNVQQGGERIVRVDPKDGKPATTVFRRVQSLRLHSGEAATLVEAELITGRTHQIRVHAAHLGMPIAGDPKYGDAGFNRRLKALGLNRLFLHAHVLAFRPAHLERALRVESALPDELQGLIARIGSKEGQDHG